MQWAPTHAQLCVAAENCCCCCCCCQALVQLLAITARQCRSCCQAADVLMLLHARTDSNSSGVAAVPAHRPQPAAAAATPTRAARTTQQLCAAPSYTSIRTCRAAAKVAAVAMTVAVTRRQLPVSTAADRQYASGRAVERKTACRTRQATAAAHAAHLATCTTAGAMGTNACAAVRCC